MTTTIGLGDGLIRLARLAGHDPQCQGPRASRRRAAVEWIEAHGFPTRRDEDWRYLPLGPLLTAELHLPDPMTSSPSNLLALAPELGGPRLVFLNGCFMPAASRLSGMPEGVVVTEGTVEDKERLYASDDCDADYRHAFEALNAALSTDDITVAVAPGLIVREPIHLSYVSVPSDLPVASSPRINLVAGERSRVHLVETYMSVEDSSGLTNAVTTVRLEKGALVEIDSVQDEAEDRWHFSLLDVCQAEDSKLHTFSAALGGSIARHEVRVCLAGDRAEAILDGLYMPRGDQHHDQPILIEHRARNTRSRQRYQGVADGKGHGVFNGRVVVHRDAYDTDAGQLNHNLLLSDHAEIDTRPRLEIFNDEVNCTHGATVGRIDDAALYYLRSRGIPKQPAQALLVHAAVDQVVDRIGSVNLRADVGRRVAAVIDSSGDA